MGVKPLNLVLGNTSLKPLHMIFDPKMQIHEYDSNVTHQVY